MRTGISGSIVSVGQALRLLARWLLRLTTLFITIPLLAACSPRTEAEQIAAANRRIAPEGFLTKTHLYVHWPAVYTQPKQHTHWKEPGGEEIAPAVTLKIPFEYLGQTVVSFETAAKIARHDAGEKDIDDEAIDYYARVKTAVRVSGHQIVSIYLRFQPGAKPDNPLLIYKTDPPEVASQKLAYFLDSYAVHIKRNHYFVVPLYERRTRVSDKFTDAASYAYEKSPSLSCIGTSCFLSFSVKGRHAEIGGDNEAVVNPYKAKAARSSPRVAKPDTSSNQETVDSPKWREKLDPTQALLKSFVLPEESPEVQGLFYKK